MRTAGEMDDFIIDQEWETYAPDEHAVWRHLFRRQTEVLNGRAAPEFWQGLRDLGLSDERIPDLRRLGERLAARTGWRIVAVPGLVPDEIFYHHLARRTLLAVRDMRPDENADTPQQPDLFHDVFGRVPMLTVRPFAEFLEALGKAGEEETAPHHLGRLYRHTAELGLIRTDEGLRIYGTSLLCSDAEARWCLESEVPNRIRLDRRRVMLTPYNVERFQRVYFVIDRFEELPALIGKEIAEFSDSLAAEKEFAPESLGPEDEILHRGTVTAREGGA